MIHQDFGVTIHGASFYEDRYVKVDGEWQIASTGYKRTYEEIWPRKSLEGLKISADFWATGGRSEPDLVASAQSSFSVDSSSRTPL